MNFIQARLPRVRTMRNPRSPRDVWSSRPTLRATRQPSFSSFTISYKPASYPVNAAAPSEVSARRRIPAMGEHEFRAVPSPQIGAVSVSAFALVLSIVMALGRHVLVRMRLPIAARRRMVLQVLMQARMIRRRTCDYRPALDRGLAPARPQDAHRCSGRWSPADAHRYPHHDSRSNVRGP